MTWLLSFFQIYLPFFRRSIRCQRHSFQNPPIPNTFEAKKKKRKKKSEETSIDLVFWLEFASYLVAAALPLPFFLSRGNSELWSSSDASALSCAFCETSWRMAAKWTEEKKLTTSKRGRKRVKREARRQEEETASFRAIAGARVAAVTSSACRRRDAFFPSGLQQPSGCCSQ